VANVEIQANCVQVLSINLCVSVCIHILFWVVDTKIEAKKPSLLSIDACNTVPG